MAIDFGGILDAIPNMVWAMPSEGGIEYANQLWVDYTGRDPTTSPNLQWQDVLDPADLSTILERCQAIHASGVPGNMEARMRRSDGAWRRFRIRWTPLAAGSGIATWCGVATGINSLDVAVADEPSKLDFQVDVDRIPVPVAVTTPSGEIEGLNRPAILYFGIRLDDVKNQKASDVVHPDDLKNSIFGELAAHISSRPYIAESRQLRDDGVYRWHNVLGFPLRNRSGEIERWFHFLIDIEDRREVQDQSKARERHLLETINALPTTAWSTRPDGYCDFLSDRWLDYAGFTFEQAEGWGWARTIHPADVGALSEVWTTCLATGDPVDVEARMRGRGGEYRWFIFRANPLRDEQGKIVKWYGTNIDIEDRKRAEEALIESEQDARSIFNRIPALLATNGPNGENDGLNDQFRKYLGLSGTSARNWRTDGIVHPDDLPMVIAAIERSGATGEPTQFECRLRGADGAYRWFLRRSLPFRDINGDIARWYSVCTDIDDRRVAEEKLRESERQLRLIVETIPGLVVVFGPDGDTVGANDQTLAYVGQTFEEFRNWAINGTAHPDDLASAMASFTRSLAGGEPYEFEVRLRRHDGIYRWFQIRGRPARDNSDIITHWHALMTDIDDRKRAEEALARSERELSLIVHNMAGMIAIFTPDALLDGCNQQLLDYFQLPMEGIATWATNGMVHPEDLQHCIDSFTGSIASGEPYDFETRFRRFDGVYRWFHIRGHPVRDEKGCILRWYGLLIDIDDRRRMEDELRRKESFLADAARISQTGYCSWKVGTEEIEFSEESYKIFQTDPTKPMTVGLCRLRTHPDDIPTLHRVMEEADVVGSTFDYQVRLVMPDQSIKHIRVVQNNFRNENGDLILRGIVQDVTARHLADEALGNLRSELAHISRVATLGAFTASIAHEVNQPLSGIVTNASTCLRMLAAVPPNIDVAIETARRTIRDGNRAADVIARLRALFTKQTVAFGAVDLVDAAREVITLSSSDLQRGGVVLHTELTKGLPPVYGDRVQLQQVALNLIRNAIDAMGEIRERPKRLVISTHRDEANRIRLSVQDTGVGLGEDEEDRIFETFYTTKSDGMGIGLAVSRSIIENHNGMLSAQRNDGPGTTVSFSVPIYADVE
jgi:PAS domain S-box-containing protein